MKTRKTSRRAAAGGADDPPANRRQALQLIAGTCAALALGGPGAPSLEARGAPAGATVPDAATATPKVARVKLENDRVRVLEFTSDPGDKEGWHFHPAFAVYVVTGGTLRITTADGKSNDVSFRAGDILFREPITHTTENIGKTRVHAILVELKTP
jgi:quercetin dioxygenase-like cupin family protein